MANGWGFVGFLESHVSEIACPSWLQESELLRLKAFILFGKLAQVVRISKKHFFKQEVKKAWVPLMLHCQDPCSDAAQVRHTWALWATPRARCPHKEHVLRGCCPSSWGVPCRPQSSRDPRGHHLLVPPTRLRKGPVKITCKLTD